jgi:beta-glucuronidase
MLYPQQNQVRNTLDLSGIWDFQTDPEELGAQQAWFNGLDQPRPIAVPGSWNEQHEDLFNYLGLAWYLKRSYVPSSWKGQRIFLRVGSANYFARVYVNGHEVGSHDGGHLPFAFEISDFVQWDSENVFAISVENHLTATRVPSGNIRSPLGAAASFPATTYDFFPFAGLHRPVVLYTTPANFIEDIAVVTDIDGNTGKVSVSVKLNAPLNGRGLLSLAGTSGPLESDLRFKDGLATSEIIVPNARFWSDTDPYLYQLSVRAGEDFYSLPIGIRTIAVKDGAILLNGQPIKMNGFGRHEDFIASGRGLNLPLMVKDYQLMRWVGANSYRTSHYPYSEEEMQLADREGFLIIDETPAVSLQFENDEHVAARLQACQQQLSELIARDKNHPSVVAWSVANEPLPARLAFMPGGDSNEPDLSIERGKHFLDTLLDQAHELDPTRLATVVTVMGGPSSWMEQCDFICMNRYWGWYIMGGQLDKAMAGLEKELDSVWEQWQKPIMMTEFGADTMAGMHGHPNVMWTEEYQADLIRGHLAIAERKHYIAGMQIWNFADFAAVQSIMRVGGLNMKGIFTRTRTPKLAAHVLREFWHKER